MNAKELIPLCILCLGAIFSIYKFIINRRDRYPRIKAHISDDQIYSGKTTGPVFIQLKVINHGLVDVILNHILIQSKNKKLTFTPESQHVNFPYLLNSQKSMQILCDPLELAIEFNKNICAKKIRIRGIFQDSIGNNYKTKIIRFNIKYFLRDFA